MKVTAENVKLSMWWILEYLYNSYTSNTLPMTLVVYMSRSSVVTGQY